VVDPLHSRTSVIRPLFGSSSDRLAAHAGTRLSGAGVASRIGSWADSPAPAPARRSWWPRGRGSTPPAGPVVGSRLRIACLSTCPRGTMTIRPKRHKRVQHLPLQAARERHDPVLRGCVGHRGDRIKRVRGHHHHVAGQGRHRRPAVTSGSPCHLWSTTWATPASPVTSPA